MLFSSSLSTVALIVMPLLAFAVFISPAEAFRRVAGVCPRDWTPQGDQGNGCPLVCMNRATGEKFYLLVRYTVKGALLKGCSQCEDRWIEGTDCRLIICPEDSPPCPEDRDLGLTSRSGYLGRSNVIAVPVTVIRRTFGNGTIIRLPGGGYIRPYVPTHPPRRTTKSSTIPAVDQEPDTTTAAAAAPTIATTTATAGPEQRPEFGPLPELSFTSRPMRKKGPSSFHIRFPPKESSQPGPPSAPAVETTLSSTAASEVTAPAVFNDERISMTTPIAASYLPTTSTTSESASVSSTEATTTTIATMTSAQATTTAPATAGTAATIATGVAATPDGIPPPAAPPIVKPQYRPGTRLHPDNS